MQSGYISEFSKGRNNNLNLVRFIAAVSVLISHSYPLYYGLPEIEPLFKLIGKSAGGVAVDIFFITSGFLIAKSFLNRSSINNYIWSRVIRIYPGLWFVLLATLIVFIPAAHPEAYKSIILSSDALYYTIKNSIILLRPEYAITGAYEDNPYPSAINGSLWTLPWELYCYILIAVGIFSIQKIFRTHWIKVYHTVGLIALAYIAGTDLDLLKNNKNAFIIIAFYVGSLCYINRARIKLNFTSLVIAILLMITNFVTLHTTLIYILTLTYSLFYLAYIPSGKIRKFNNIGDYSYGIYIFAFPIQQSIIKIWPEIGFIAYIVSSLLLTLVFSWFSWNFIEERSLRLKTLVT